MLFKLEGKRFIFLVAECLAELSAVVILKIENVPQERRDLAKIWGQNIGSMSSLSYVE